MRSTVSARRVHVARLDEGRRRPWLGRLGASAERSKLYGVERWTLTAGLDVRWGGLSAAAGVFSNDTTQDLTGQVAWTSSNGAVASTFGAWTGTKSGTSATGTGWFLQTTDNGSGLTLLVAVAPRVRVRGGGPSVVGCAGVPRP